MKAYSGAHSGAAAKLSSWQRNYYLEPEQICHGTGYVLDTLLMYGIIHNVCVFRSLMGNDQSSW